MVINDRIPKTEISLPTDDWPFLYLKEKSIPFAYWFTLSVLFLISLFVVKKILASPSGGFIHRFLERNNLFMFLLGTGFMLVEVKSISDLSLLFGSTWIVNSVVIAAILTMILLANLLVLKCPPQSMIWVYAGLTISLVFNYLFKPVNLAGISFAGKAVLGGLLSALPIFFAGVAFATAFRKVQDVSRAFGANLLGALVGGILENLSMVYGVAFLNLVALAIYLFSLVVYLRLAWKAQLIPARSLEGPSH